MTVKQFFKGKAFKCIAVLMSVLLISGVLLALCWGFLEVTDDERFNRKIGSVYGGDTVTATEQDISGKNTSVNDAKIQKLWYIEEKNDYLVQAASRGNGGDVTCWIAVKMSDTDKKTVVGISKVLFYSCDDAAEYVGNISESIYDKFPAEYTDGKQFSYGDKTSGEFIGTNASFTMTAICNDVNGAVAFVKAYASGGDIVDPFASFQYKALINTNKTSWTVDGEEISYTIVTKGNDGPASFTIKIKVDASATIKEYSIEGNGCEEDGEHSAQDYIDKMSAQAKDLTGKTLADITGYLNDSAQGGTLHTGATRSNELCYNAAAFALANYTACLTTPSKGGN